MSWEKNFDFLEKKYQKILEERNIFNSKIGTNKKKFYCLVMFPYPSGKLHMGHVRNYVIGDVIARYKRLCGYNVFHPIGWDAFGLPAENAAIKHKIHPEKWTMENISTMRGQLKRLGISYNWSAEIFTCSPEYYKWNQWFFLKMYERNLVYRKKSLVNWCPDCETVLANEQVHNGLCWRCDSEVVQKELEQWFIKITDYAERLLEDHALISQGWPEEVITMQKNWIGKSVGAEIKFKIYPEINSRKYELIVFTTRADTLFGATFIALSPEHELSNIIANSDSEVRKYLEVVKKKPLHIRKLEKEKTGVKTNFFAINPVNDEKIPVFIADYVLMEYGTGAIMCVPAHDQRDFEFAKKFNLPIKEVIKPSSGETTLPDFAYEGEGIMVNSGKFTGLPSEKGKEAIVEELMSRNLAVKKVNYRLKDWLISRQRYWGTPIPIIYCPDCGTLPVREEDLPVVLPQNVEITGLGESPLKYVPEFVNTKCYKCGSVARRETDTMDTFVDSSWYYARYCDPKNNIQPFDKTYTEYWLPVDQYIGGIEHACMHLIYARFWHKVMFDLGLVSTEEPFLRLLTQGMVTLNGEVMSKSKGNIVEPEVIISKYGADTTRLFILFASPPEKQLDWNEKGVEGCWRFILRVDRLVSMILENRTKLSSHSFENVYSSSEYMNQKKQILQKYHKLLKGITEDIEKEYQFNTAIAKCMELTNTLYTYKYLGDEVSTEIVKNLIIILFPFVPHLCHYLWERLNISEDIHSQLWPKYDEKFITEDNVEIPVQVNGKLKTKVLVPYNTQEDLLKNIIISNKKISTLLTNKQIVKWIIVPNKLVNIVLDSGE